MKKIIIMILVTALIFACVGCSKEEKFEIDYPDMYTAEYCYENYVDADSSLVHLISADNSIGEYKINSVSYEYYGIKDVPLDKYLAVSHGGFMIGRPSVYIVQKSTETDEPILDYKVNKAELYWGCDPLLKYGKAVEEKFTEYGNLLHYEFVAELDSQSVVEEIREFLLSDKDISGEYKKFKSVSQKGEDHFANCTHWLRLRLYFDEYENIVWDTYVHYGEKDGNFYIHGGNKFSGKHGLRYMNISDFIPDEIKALY